jgi:quercetin dioxygenase-like cupin family protein
MRSRILLRAEETDGAISAIEIAVPAGWDGPRLHHHAFDETFHVLDGELTFQLGDDLFTAGPGVTVFAPGGAVHALANLSGAEARYLLLCTPAGFERRFEDDPPGPPPETTFVGGHIGERDDVVEATPLSPPPGPVNVLVRGEHSEGRVAVMDNIARVGAGPNLHHHDFAELFYVIDGELLFQVGDERVTRGAGELAFAPGGAVHTYANPAETGAHFLLVCTPAGFEPYFGRIAARIAGVDPPEWALAEVPEVVRDGPPII